MKIVHVFGAVLALAAALLGCGGGGECPTDGYPDAPAGASEVVHANAACPADGADGSAAHAFPTLGQAVAKAGRGGTVLVAHGTYEENLSLDADVTILGSATDGSRGDDAAIILQAPEPNAIKVMTGATVALTGFRLEAPQESGIWAHGGSVTVTSSRVEGATLFDEVADVADGFVATDNGAIILQDVAAVDNVGLGALVLGASATLTDVLFENNGGSIRDGGGLRLEGAIDDVRVENAVFRANHGYGVGVFSSGAIILQSQALDTALDRGIGDGVVVGSTLGSPVAAALEMHDTEVTGNARVGVLCAAGAGAIILQRGAISNNGAGAPFGAGFWMQQGAGQPGNSIDGVEFAGNHFVGVGLSGDTHGIILQNNHVGGTQLREVIVDGSSQGIGDGIDLFGQASARIVGMNHIEGNARAGVVMDDVAAATEVRDNLIEDNEEYGIILQNQSMGAPDVGSNMFSGNGKGEELDVPFGSTGGYGLIRADFEISAP